MVFTTTYNVLLKMQVGEKWKSLCEDYRLIYSHFMSFSDPYHGRGTAYLHIPENATSEHGDSKENPTGAVVFPISMATTFRQTTPGMATLPEDPNSFGKGYEYSRTGK
jgi:hypothetical protein